QNVALERNRAELVAQVEGDRERLRADSSRFQAEQDAWNSEQGETRRTLALREADLSRESQAVWADRNLVQTEQARIEQRAAQLSSHLIEVQEREAGLALRRVQFNTERELDSRVLQDGLWQLRVDRARWQSRRDRERSALEVRRLLLVEGERKIGE